MARNVLLLFCNNVFGGVFMAEDTLMFMFRMMKAVFKIVWTVAKPILLFTGLIYPALLSVLSAITGWQPGVVWWVLVWFLMAYTFIQSIARLFMKDKSFKLYKALFKGSQSRLERRSTNPKVNTALCLSEPSGVVFGRSKGSWVCKPASTDGHIAVCGGPGSGKSAAVAIGTLLCWGNENSKDAVFAIDIKGELHQKTKHRLPNNKVFSLTSPNSYGYNPFFLIDENGDIIKQIKNIAVSLIPIPPEEKNPFWKQSAQNYLCGCLLWGFMRKIEFAEIMEMIQAVPPEKMATAICEDEFKEPKLFMNAFADMAHDTLSGVYTEVSNTVLPFATDSELRAALSKPKAQCISPADLDNGISLYIHLEEHRLDQLRNFLTLLVNQFLKHFEQRSEDEGNNHILFQLDEFPRLSKIDSIMTGLATLRSKKITIMLVFQSLAQLDVIYGKDQRKAILDNCSFWALLRVSDSESQKYFSDAIGTYDRSKRSYSDNRGDFKALGSSGSSITTEEKRIIKPEDLNKLENELILMSPYGFNRVEKVYYFKDAYFQKLLAE